MHQYLIKIVKTPSSKNHLINSLDKKTSQKSKTQLNKFE